jgi:hypothetical protein
LESWYSGLVTALLEKPMIRVSPLKAGPSSRIKASANPVTFVDPSGLQPGFPGIPPLPQTVPVPPILPSATVDFSLYFYGLTEALSIAGQGLCRCPQGYSPVKDSAKTKSLNIIEYLTHEFPNSVVAERYSVYEKPPLRGSNVGGVGTSWVAAAAVTCRCRNECGEEVEVPVEIDRDSLRRLSFPIDWS